MATLHYYLFLSSEGIYLHGERGNDVKDKNELLPDILIQGGLSFGVLMVNMTIIT